MNTVNNPALSQQVLLLLEQEYTQEKPLPHLTELIYCLTRSYYDRKDALPPTRREILHFALGFGLERILLQHQRKSEVGIVDGVNFSPDFLAFTDLPGELKTTRMSMKKLNEVGIPITWQRQILGYIKCLGISEYELVVLNYVEPDIYSFRVSAETEEIDGNWNWIQTRKTFYMACIESNQVPFPRVFCEDWECRNCRYAIRCEAGVTESSIQSAKYVRKV